MWTIFVAEKGSSNEFFHQTIFFIPAPTFLAKNYLELDSDSLCTIIYIQYTGEIYGEIYEIYGETTVIPTTVRSTLSSTVGPAVGTTARARSAARLTYGETYLR